MIRDAGSDPGVYICTVRVASQLVLLSTRVYSSPDMSALSGDVIVLGSSIDAAASSNQWKLSL